MTAAVYWPVAKQGFINFDDPDYVSSNPRVQAGLTLGKHRVGVHEPSMPATGIR